MHQSLISLVAATLFARAFAEDFCTFYSDSSCKTNANSVSYSVANQGCFSAKGQYIKCNTGTKDIGVNLRHFHQTGCPTDTGLQHTIQGATCVDLASSNLYEPSGSYQLESESGFGKLKRESFGSTNETVGKRAATCTATVNVWDSTDCTGSPDSFSYNVTPNEDTSTASGCYATAFAQSAAYETASSQCYVRFYSSNNCASGTEATTISPLYEKCSSTDLDGAGSPGSLQFICPVGACGNSG